MPPTLYRVCEIFDSVQGEGEDSGAPVTFVRFAGCNQNCLFCDTNYDTNYSSFSIKTVEEIVRECGAYVVFTGGEPLLHNLEPLVIQLGPRHFGLETNGTLPVPECLQMAGCKVSLSPKIPRAECQVKSASSLKILYPYMDGVRAEDWLDFSAGYKSLQVIDPEKKDNIAPAIAEVQRLGFPWRLGLQLHKFIGVR